MVRLAVLFKPERLRDGGGESGCPQKITAGLGNTRADAAVHKRAAFLLHRGLIWSVQGRTIH